MSAPPVWGGLAKAQDDPETIEEAIARLIVAHEENINAHAETDQSLDAHKSEDVIDHPAGSIPFDKETLTQDIIKCNFETIDGWTKTGDAVLESYGRPKLTVENGVTELSKLRFFPILGYSYYSSSSNPNYQSTLWIQSEDDSNYLAFWGVFYLDVDNSIINGWGFKFNNQVLSGYIKSGVTEDSCIISGIDVKERHIYRIVLDYEANKIIFYIDGENEGEIAGINSYSFLNSYPVYSLDLQSEIDVCGLFAMNFNLASTKPT